MSEQRHANGFVAPDEVRAQLERILESQALRGSDQLKRLLRMTVERTLDGHPELLKEYNIGLEAFHRPPDYDPKVDPIVRVQARRLRAKLDEYYAGDGARDPIVIHMPKGAYLPAFELRPANVAVTDTTRTNRTRILMAAAVAVVMLAVLVGLIARSRDATAEDLDRSVAVLPLQMFSEGSSHSHVANQITEVLTTELAKNKEIRVLSRTTAASYRKTNSSLPEIAQALGVRWVIEGGVGLEGSRAYVKLRAVDSRIDRKIWADVFDCELNSLVAVNSRAAQNIATAILAQRHSSQP